MQVQRLCDATYDGLGKRQRPLSTWPSARLNSKEPSYTCPTGIFGRPHPLILLQLARLFPRDFLCWIIPAFSSVTYACYVALIWIPWIPTP